MRFDLIYNLLFDVYLSLKLELIRLKELVVSLKTPFLSKSNQYFILCLLLLFDIKTQ